MEALVDEPIEEGQVVKTHTENVAQVLASNRFLKNAGLQVNDANSSSTTSYAARVRELEAEVLVEKQGNAALQGKIDVLEQKVLASEEARNKQLEEIEALKRHAEETDIILRHKFNVSK